MQAPTTKNWDVVNTAFLIATPILAVGLTGLWLWRDGFSWSILGLGMFMYLAAGISITAGYHRLLSHRAYEAHPIVRFICLFFGAGAFQNSALKWCSDHRVHHAHEDGEKDPYNVKKGLFYAHMGWIMWREDHLILKSYPKDLELDPIVRWQHRYYLPVAVIAGFVFPTLLGAALGSWLGGLAVGGFLRIVIVHHATFSVNSLCHKFGHAPYDNNLTAKDSYWLSFFTYGESYHNFHHSFPTDYRNGIRWYHFDPTKWTIRGLAFMGLAKKLRTTDTSLMLRTRQRGMAQAV